ncbi:MAG: acyltransferase [Oscillospiraceae bacterium]|nr:acyltransferase [Oscillospiraceae bacterium]
MPTKNCATCRGGQSKSPFACADYTISAIRFLAMIFIICCHIMQYLNLELAWWFNVGVQIFLCISGYLYGQRCIGDIPSFYAKRFKKILLPYYIVFILYGTFQFMFARNMFTFGAFLRGLLLNTTLQGAGHLWFVPTILMCYVITPLLERYRDKYIASGKSLFIYAVISVMIVSLFYGGFARFYNPAWISCYVIGYALGINKEKNYIKQHYIDIISVIVAGCGNSLQIYFSYVLDRTFPGYIYFCDYNHVTLGMCIFLLLYRFFNQINFTKLKKFLEITDKLSYEVYLVHHLIILGPFSLMKLTTITSLNIVVILAIIGILAFVLAQLENIIGNMLNRHHQAMKKL